MGANVCRRQCHMMGLSTSSVITTYFNDDGISEVPVVV